MVAQRAGQTVIDRVSLDDLGTLLERRGTLELATLTAIARGVGDALRERHGLNEAHGGLSPATVDVELADGEVQSVKVLERGETTDLHYRSPEQISGREIDPRTDAWALGVILFRGLVGRAPFVADDDAALKTAITQRAFVRPSTLSKELPAGTDEFFVRALRKDAVERFQTMDELVEAFAGLSKKKAPAPEPKPQEKRVELVTQVSPVHVEPTERAWERNVPRVLIAAACLSFFGFIAYKNADLIVSWFKPRSGSSTVYEAPRTPTPPPAVRPESMAPVELDGPGGRLSLPLDSVFIMNVWLQACPDCMPSFEAWKKLVEDGGVPKVPIVNVAYGTADKRWAEQYLVADGLVSDSGDAIVRPLGIGRFTTFVIAPSGKILFAGTPVDRDFAKDLAAAAATH